MRDPDRAELLQVTLYKWFSYYIKPITYNFRNTTFNDSKNSIIRKGNFKNVSLSPIFEKICIFILFITYFKIQTVDTILILRYSSTQIFYRCIWNFLLRKLYLHYWYKETFSNWDFTCSFRLYLHC